MDAKLKLRIGKKRDIRYITGVELNVTFSHPHYHDGKAVSLDFLGYQFDPNNETLESKLQDELNIVRNGLLRSWTTSILSSQRKRL